MTPALDYRDLAKTAYDAYCARSGGKSLISAAPLPAFEDVKLDIQDAWAAASYAVAVRVEAQSRNYIANEEQMPDSVTFANGRTVRIADNTAPNVHLGVFLEVV